MKAITVLVSDEGLANFAKLAEDWPKLSIEGFFAVCGEMIMDAKPDEETMSLYVREGYARQIEALEAAANVRWAPTAKGKRLASAGNGSRACR